MYFLQQGLWVLGVVLAAALGGKLLFTRLYRAYFWFFIYLVVEVVRSLILLPLRPESGAYMQVFLVGQPITWLLCIMVVLELYSLALRNHPGIASLSRWMLSAGMVVSVGVTALTLSADLSRPPGRYKVLVYYSVIERGLGFSLVLFLLLITVFLVLCPISIRRNTVLHASVFSIHFLAVSMLLFLRNLAGYQMNVAVSTVLVFVDCVCYLLWLSGLNRAGEEDLLVVRSKWQPEDEEKLLGQLDALGDALRRGPDR
jgi:hypothetical protein